MVYLDYPPASKGSMAVANLTERKIHIPTFMVSKNLSVCLFDPNYLRTGKTVTIFDALAQKDRLVKSFKSSPGINPCTYGDHSERELMPVKGRLLLLEWSKSKQSR